jgi:hypothetical protein
MLSKECCIFIDTYTKTVRIGLLDVYRGSAAEKFMHGTALLPFENHRKPSPSVFQTIRSAGRLDREIGERTPFPTPRLRLCHTRQKRHDIRTSQQRRCLRRRAANDSLQY